MAAAPIDRLAPAANRISARRCAAGYVRFAARAAAANVAHAAGERRGRCQGTLWG